MKAPFRIGLGFDVHRTGPGDTLVLGGLRIPAPYALVGHSDADCLLHAVIDALLGAAALGCIGDFFPDTDPRFRGIDSRLLLTETLSLVSRAGFTPAQLDAIIICEKPRLAPYLPAIASNLAGYLSIEPGQVGMKAKTYEKIGPLGEGLALECRCVIVLLNSE